MSTDVLRRQLAHHIEYVRRLQVRNLPHITCALARLEDVTPREPYVARYDPKPRAETFRGEAVLRDAVFHPPLRVSRPLNLSPHVSNCGPSYARLFYPMPAACDWSVDRRRPLSAGLPYCNHIDEADEALRVASEACEFLNPVVGALPASLAERLGFIRTVRSYSWVETLFHLGWHFPDRGIEADRRRVLVATAEAPWEFACPELDLQLGRVRSGTDAFPGVILSRLGRISDVLTASVNALSKVDPIVETRIGRIAQWVRP